jgi:hypothetical protein
VAEGETELVKGFERVCFREERQRGTPLSETAFWVEVTIAKVVEQEEGLGCVLGGVQGEDVGVRVELSEMRDFLANLLG